MLLRERVSVAREEAHLRYHDRSSLRCEKRCVRKFQPKFIDIVSAKRQDEEAMRIGNEGEKKAGSREMSALSKCCSPKSEVRRLSDIPERAIPTSISVDPKASPTLLSIPIIGSWITL